jgi:Protein kinase domain/AAA ATPase domain
LVGGRYRLAGLLGEGGMAVVHQALDLSTGRRVALKRMRAPEHERKRAHLTSLFEREFLTLSQLAHPRVVAAYDYGIERDAPYYTMELLDGGDLHYLAPVPWQKACAFGRDVCSALSLLHSRRMVYRDLSPRNVRCTEQGQAKLIDFGAMTAMGPTREVVGTPPFVAPEALNMQPLDARTDLYGLGATLYYALTRRHAFPARSFGQLWELWRVAPPPPSTFNSQVPEALDRLVLELIHTDPALRPANAAEVMLRLATIADLPADEHLLVHRAYLSAPTLVGRSSALDSARELMKRARDQHGASLLVHGAQGSGRSRFLDACTLEAKLSGLLVVRADASDAEEGDYSLVRSLFHELLLAARAPLLRVTRAHLAVLGHVLPELLEHAPCMALETLREGELHARVQPLLKGCLLSVAQERPLLLAVDDVARADEPSRALLSILAQDVAQHSLVLVTTLASDELRQKERSAAIALLAQGSTPSALAALDLEQTKQLLSSVFGDVPNLPVLAAYAEQIAAGNPRDLMRLAQHLVSEEVIRYASGIWSLPERLHGAHLPATMADALSLRIARLGPHAKNLAYAFAAEPKQKLTLDECLALSQGSDPSQLLQILRELLDTGVIVRAGPRYRLSQLGFAEPLKSALSEAELRAVHERLAMLFEMQGDGLRSAQHLLRAGDEERGLSTLLLDAVESEKSTNVRPEAFFEELSALPHDWLQTYDLALQLCDKLARPERERDILLSRLNGYISHAVRDTDGFRFLKMRIDRLEKAVGLDLYASLPDSLDPGTRLRTSFEQAKARFQSTPPEQRAHEPSAAIKPLATTLLAALATIGFTNDAGAYQQLPSLAPLALISPTLGVVHGIMRGVGARIQGRCEDAMDIYEELLLRLAAEDRAELKVSEHRMTQLRVALSLGALEANMGHARCLTRVELVESEPGYMTQALMLRHLHQLWQGDGHEAARTQQALEQQRAFSNSHHGFDGQYLLGEICAHAFADDLTRVKQATDIAEVHAQIHRGWAPVMYYGRGEHLRIRGDFVAALAEFETALALMREHPHQIWANVAGAHLRTLVELAQYERASTLGQGYLRHAQERGLGYLANYVRMPLSLALARSGQHERARALAQRSITDFERLGSTGLNLAAAYETRARVALDAGDATGYERYAALSLDQCRSGNRRLLRTKLERAAPKKPSAEAILDQQRMAQELSAALGDAPNDSERARRGLAFLSRYSEAMGGVLYALRGGQLQRAASFGELPAPAALDEWARLYFEGQRAAHEAATSDVELKALANEANAAVNERYLPTMLGHEEPDGYQYTGLALLVMPTSSDLSWLNPISIALSRSLFAIGTGVNDELGSCVRHVDSEPEE